MPVWSATITRDEGRARQGRAQSSPRTIAKRKRSQEAFLLRVCKDPDPRVILLEELHPRLNVTLRSARWRFRAGYRERITIEPDKVGGKPCIRRL
jgi:hypothetical protein